jgi:RsiW-degrading membrane proteinase PrsW (M82 family)
MIAAYKRNSGIATIVFVASLAGGIALTPSGKNMWDNAPLGPLFGITYVVTFFLAFWWYIKAKGRSGAWILMLFLNLLGMLVILLLKDRCENGLEPVAEGAPLKN